MTANGWFQIFFFFALVLLCAKPLGIYMARVFERERTLADRIFRPIERLIYRLTGIDETHEMAGRSMRLRCCCSASSRCW